MTETQYPSEMEAALDNLEMLFEAVSVARQKVRDRNLRRTPARAPRRPGAEPMDWVRDAEDEEPAPAESGQAPAADGAEVPESVASADGEVRDLMARLAVMSERHRQQLEDGQEEAAAETARELAELENVLGEADLTLDSLPAMDERRAYWFLRAAAERRVHPEAVTAQVAQEQATQWDQEQQSIQQQSSLAQGVQEAQRDQQQQAAQQVYAERIEQIEAEQEQITRAKSHQDGERFTSELRLPLMVGASSLVVQGGSEALENLYSNLEELGARIEGEEVVVPIEGMGDDTEASMDSRVEAWRSVTAEDLGGAAASGVDPANLAYLRATAGEEPLVLDGAVAAEGQEMTWLRATEEGVETEAAVLQSEVPQEAWADLRERFDEAEPGVILVPVSADPHEAPEAAVDAARADLPTSLYAQHALYEQQVQERRADHVAEDETGVWRDVEPQVDLVEKHRADGSLEAVLWVDAEGQPTRHPDGVPSMWMDEKGSPLVFGHYENGKPEGEWVWADQDSGAFASDRAELHEGVVVPGTQQHRESVEDGWTTVGEDAGADQSGPRADSEGPDAEQPSLAAGGQGEDGLDATAASTSPGPDPMSRRPEQPPMAEPSKPMRGPRMH